MQHLEHALDELVQLSTGREHRPELGGDAIVVDARERPIRTALRRCAP
jgi:hypothetical protein